MANIDHLRVVFFSPVWTLATILRDEGHVAQGVQRGEKLIRAARFARLDADHQLAKPCEPQERFAILGQRCSAARPLRR